MRAAADIAPARPTGAAPRARPAGARAWLGAAAALAAVAGCASFPEVDAQQTRAAATAPWPALAPLEEFAEAEAGLAVTEADTAAVEARAARLRARAAALRRDAG
jgi:hypothetical protein